MEREMALEISEFLAEYGVGIAHKIEYTPSYGYVVGASSGSLSEDVKSEIQNMTGKKPVHGKEYR